MMAVDTEQATRIIRISRQRITTNTQVNPKKQCNVQELRGMKIEGHKFSRLILKEEVLFEKKN